MTSRTTGRSFAAALLTVVALLAAGLASPAGAAAGTGKLKGVVSVDGTPISFAKVQVYRAVYDDGSEEYEVAAKKLKTDNTDSRGRFSFSGLSVTSGQRYVLLVTDRTGKTVKTFRIVDVKKGRTTTKNVQMKAAATLTGRIGTSDGRSPAGLTVGVDGSIDNQLGPSYLKLYPDFSTTVRANGTFTLPGLPRGTYEEVSVSDGQYARQCYDFSAGVLADCAANTAPNVRAQEITVGGGERRALPSVTASQFAPPATKVAGKVTDTSGKALKGITVRITSDNVSQTVVTRSSGRYTLDEQIPGGTYQVRFDDPQNVWASQYLGGGPDKSVRQRVTITPGQPVGNLDTRLKSVSTAKIASQGGRGTAKVAFQIKRKATGSAPSGTLTLSFQGISKTVTVTKGKATVTLTGLRAGTRSLVAAYSGTSSTASFSKVVKVVVK